MATNESLVLGGVEQNSNVGDFVIIDGSLSMNPPRKKSEWVTGADADGAALVRDPLFENRTIEYDLRVRGQSTTDGALGKIAAISDKLEEAERQEDGLALVWTPAGGTRSVTFRVLSGEITELPITRTGDGRGWFRAYPVFHVVLTCKPFGYGTEVVGTAVTSSAPVVTTTIAGVAGDVPAEGRLIVTDAVTGGMARRHVEWGLEQRHYNAATALLVDSDAMTTTGYAGAGATRTGAYDPDALGNNVIRATIYPPAIAVCGIGNLSHVGTFRVKARVYTTAASGYVRLGWSFGDGPRHQNAWQKIIVNNGFYEADLGIVSIPEVTLGTQRWSGAIEAYCDDTSATFDVDYLVLVPAGEGYGRARATYPYRPGVIVAGDQFNAVTAGTALNARVAPIGGGTWATLGATTDFTAADEPNDETFSRSTNADAGQGRLAVLGATNYTNTQARVALQHAGSDQRSRLIVRYTDAENYAFAEIDRRSTPTQFRTGVRVVGVETVIRAEAFGWNPHEWAFLRVIAHASGRILGVIERGGGVVASMDGHHPSLATGGVLATGKPGFSDFADFGSAKARYYEDFYVSTPAAEPIVVQPGQSLEIRHDSALAEDPTGTYWGNAQSYRGSRFLVPPAGDEVRTSRVLVKARRHDLLTAADDQIADATTVTVAWTPRYVVVPR